MADTDLVSTREAARILLRSIATVNRFAADGRLQVAKKVDGVRGARFYWRRDVEALRDEIADHYAPLSPSEAAS